MADEEPRAAAAEPGVRHSQSYKLQQLKILEGLASGTARPTMEDFKAQVAGAGASAAAQEAARLEAEERDKEKKKEAELIKRLENAIYVSSSSDEE